MRFFRCKSYIGVAHPLGSCGATLGSKAESDGSSLRWVARASDRGPECLPGASKHGRLSVGNVQRTSKWARLLRSACHSALPVRKVRHVSVSFDE